MKGHSPKRGRVQNKKILSLRTVMKDKCMGMRGWGTGRGKDSEGAGESGYHFLLFGPPSANAESEPCASCVSQSLSFEIPSDTTAVVSEF